MEVMMKDSAKKPIRRNARNRIMMFFTRPFIKFWEKYQWLIIGGLWLAAFVLGYIGVKNQLELLGDMRSFWDPFYRALQLFVVEDDMVVRGPDVPWELELARFLLPVIAAYTVVAAMAAAFHEALLDILLPAEAVPPSGRWALPSGRAAGIAWPALTARLPGRGRCFCGAASVKRPGRSRAASPGTRT